MEEKKSPIAVPIAIVLAGLLIAGAVYFSNRNRPIEVSQNQNSQNTVPTADISLSPVSQKDYIRGNPNAKVVLVEFSDTECPFCKVFHGTMKGLVDKLSKDSTLAWVYRNFPIKELHPKAPREAEALLCAGKLGGQNAFWSYTDRLYSITPSNNKLEDSQLPLIAKDAGLDVTDFNTCLSSGEMTSVVTADYNDGAKAGANGTPFSVLIAQKAFDKKAVEKLLVDSALKYKFPVNLFQISNDNKKISISGAMPDEFMTALIALLSK